MAGAALTLGSSTPSGMKVTFTLSLLNVVGLTGDGHSQEERWCFQMYPTSEINSFLDLLTYTCAMSLSSFVWQWVPFFFPSPTVHLPPFPH